MIELCIFVEVITIIMTRCKVALVFYLTIIRDLCNRILFALC